MKESQGSRKRVEVKCDVPCVNLEGIGGLVE